MRLAICLPLLAASACGNAPVAGSDVSQASVAPAAPTADRSGELPVGGAGQPAADLSIETADGTCRVRWNGELVSLEELRERSAAAVRASLPGIPEDTSTESADAPHVRLVSPRDAPWSCVRPVVDALRRARFASVLLRPAGSEAEPEMRAVFIFAVPNVTFEYAVVEVEGGSRLRLNGRPYDLRTFPDAYVQAAVRMEFAGMHGDAVVPRSGARFSDLYDAFRMLHALEGRPFLSDCHEATPPETVTLRC